MPRESDGSLQPSLRGVSRGVQLNIRCCRGSGDGVAGGGYLAEFGAVVARIDAWLFGVYPLKSGGLEASPSATI